MTQISLLLLRIGLGAMMLTHGLPKLQRLFAEGPVQFAEVFGMSHGLSLGLAVFAEFLCSLFIIAGLLTRYAAIPLAVMMLVVVFVIHGADGFGKQELPLHYLMGYLILILSGGGKYAVDYLLRGKRRSSRF